MRNLIDYLVYVAIRVVVCIVQAWPIATCQSLARLLASLSWSLLRIRRAVIDENLRCAFPDMTVRARHELAWRMWEHFFLFLCEVAHAPRKIHQTNWRDYVSLVNAPMMMRAFFDDRPTVLVCGHYGNFEVAGYVLGLLGFPTYTIARPLDNPYLDRFVNAFRGIGGQHILSKTGSSRRVEEILAGGGILALLGDQYAGPKGCWTEFFSRPASSHKAIALFALASEAPTLFCFTRRTDRPLGQEMGAAALLDPRTMPAEMRTVPAITQWYTRLLERTIRQAPEQYWWLHRRWKDTRPRKTAERSRAA